MHRTPETSHNQTSDPALFPLTLQQVKEWTRVDANISDAELSAFIHAATDAAETIMNRPLIQREFTLTIDNWFPSEIKLPEVKVQSVTSVKYVDPDGDTQTLATTEFQVDFGGRYKKGRIVEAFGKIFPQVRDELQAVTVIYQAGYGADWNSVPKDIRQGIAYLVGHYYDTRDVVTIAVRLSENQIIPETSNDIFMRHRVSAQ